MNNYTTSIHPPVGNSDHNSVIVNILLQCDTSASKIRTTLQEFKTVYDLRTRYVENFVSHLSAIDWSVLIHFNISIDDKCKLFHSTIEDCMHVTVPTLEVPMSANDKPWITPYIKHLVHCRWKAYRSRNFNLYNKLSSLVKSKIYQAKFAFANNSSYKKENTSNLWSNVNRILGNEDNNPLQFLLNSFDNKASAANSINNFFCSVFNVSAVPSFDCSFINLDHLKVTEYDVYKEICAQKVTKSPGPDLVPSLLYHSAALFIAEPLTHLFNTSLINCYFPITLEACQRDTYSKVQDTYDR